ncbi:hypothetical protein ACWD01_31290 [Streptomyces sp. NPDC002835]|jgi:hypothetical protein
MLRSISIRSLDKMPAASATTTGPFNASVSACAAKYIAGELEPLKPARAPRPTTGGKPESKPSTSLRAGDDEWTHVEARCAQDTERLGFHVNPSRVITQYLRDTYLAGRTDGK